jgi:molybdate transport system substrate-binding protein
MYQTSGMEYRVKDKSKTIVSEPVARVIARGEADTGFQQLSELKSVKGITIVGPIPSDVQKVTIFSAGVLKGPEWERAMS